MTQPNWSDFLRGTLFPYGKRTEGPNAGEDYFKYGAFGEQNMFPALASRFLNPELPPQGPPPESYAGTPPPGSSYPRMLGEGLRAGVGYLNEGARPIVYGADQSIYDPGGQLAGNVVGGMGGFARGLFGDETVDQLLGWLGQGYDEDAAAETLGPLQGPVQQPEPPQGAGGLDISALLAGGGGGRGPTYQQPDWITSGAPSPSQKAMDAAAPAPNARRSKLEERIEQLAKGSSLPEATFKERLARVMVGLAAGYGAGIARNPEEGAIGGLGSAFTGGALESQRYSEEVTARREQQERQNQLGLTEAAGLEGQLLQIDSMDARAAAQQRLQARDLDLQAESIRQRSARLAQNAAGDPIKTIREAIGLRKDMIELERYMKESAYDDVKILTNSGEVPIGALDPVSKEAAIYALEAAWKDPQVYNQVSLQVVDAMTKDGTLASAELLGEKGKDLIQKRVTSALMNLRLRGGAAGALQR